jgi:hypothetical protein
MKNCIASLLMWSALLCSPSTPIQAAPICVTTWDLQPNAAAGTNGWSNKIQQSLFQEAAESLKKLHPDVILLQQVADLETCHQLVQALRPETYQVAICSSFRDPRTKLLSRQVAILSKAGADLAWSEPWQNSGKSPAAPGGLAFAAIRWGDKNIGIFSVQLSDGVSSGTADSGVAAFQQASDDSARQLVREIASLQNRKANRLQAFIVAYDFDTAPDVLPWVHEKTLSRLEHIGFKSALAGLPLQPIRPLRFAIGSFESALAGLPLQQQITPPGNVWQSAATLDYIFTRDTGLVAPPVTTQSALSEHDAVTFEMDSAAPKAIPAPPPLAARAELPPVKPAATLTNRPPASAALANTTTLAGSDQTILWLAGCLAGCLAVFALVRKLPRRSELQPVPATLPDSTARMPEVVRAGVIANLSRWLKQEVVRRLVSDRAQLLVTQQAAAFKVLAVDERLAKVERYIQQNNQAYEQRIDDLLKALITAREENRELIRAKIALLKAEMEKARLKAGQDSQEHQPN